MGKAEVAVVDEVYKVARQHADEEIARLKEEIEVVREESLAMGVLKKIEYDIAHNQMLKYVVLYRIKKSKDYRKSGLSWAQFCEAVGEQVRTADRIIADLKPIIPAVSDKMSEFCGMDFNKIRVLGKTISDNLSEITDDGIVLIGDERIPLTPDHAEELQAALERLIEAKDQIILEKEATIRANTKVIESKAELIKRQEKDLAKYEQEAEAKGPEEFERKFIQDMVNARTTIEGWLNQFDPRLKPLPENYTPRMANEMMLTLQALLRSVKASYDTAAEVYGDPDLDGPGWVPPHLRQSGE